MINNLRVFHCKKVPGATEKSGNFSKFLDFLTKIATDFLQSIDFVKSCQLLFRAERSK